MILQGRFEDVRRDGIKATPDEKLRLPRPLRMGEIQKVGRELVRVDRSWLQVRWDNHTVATQ